MYIHCMTIENLGKDMDYSVYIPSQTVLPECGPNCVCECVCVCVCVYVCYRIGDYGK